MQYILLLVDDDRARLEGRFDFFTDNGFRCLAAETGADALETAASYRPHIALIQSQLPDIQGDDVCLTLKQEYATSHLRVLMLSPDESREERFVSNEVGADGVLREPVSSEDILSAIKSVLATPPPSVQERKVGEGES